MKRKAKFIVYRDEHGRFVKGPMPAEAVTDYSTEVTEKVHRLSARRSPRRGVMWVAVRVIAILMIAVGLFASGVAAGWFFDFLFRLGGV